MGELCKISSLIFIILISACSTTSSDLNSTSDSSREVIDKIQVNVTDSATIKNIVFDTAIDLRDNWRLAREDFVNQTLDMLMLKDTYLVTWTSDGVGDAILVILQYEKNDWKVMYHDLLGRDVLNVSVDTSFWHDAPLLIVESYYPAGVGETFTKAAFYRMDPVRTQKVLEFENAGKFVRILENDQMDIQSISASYTMPLDHMDVYDEFIPKISVYGKQTNIRMQGEEVISKMEETLESTYIWNNDKLIFEES